MRNTDQRYVSIGDAADILRVSSKTVRRYIKAGYLEAGTLPGGSIRLSRSQVLNCIKPLPKESI